MRKESHTETRNSIQYQCTIVGYGMEWVENPNP